MAPLSRVFRGRSISVTPPRAVYSDLSSAHANITGRSEAALPPLSIGWAGDQPTTAGNEKSTPVSAKARTIAQGTPVESPLAVRRARSAKPTPSGTPDIPHSELGARFQTVPPSEKGFDAQVTKSDPPSHAHTSHRRSRSTGFLGTFAWYEAEYGSNEPSYPDRQRFSFAPLDSQGSPPGGGEPSQLPHFQFPTPEDDHSFRSNVETHGKIRGLPANSTISDILQCYGDNDPPSDSTIAYDDSNSLPRVTVESLRDGHATGHRGGQLSQSAWSPRPSNDGLEFNFRRHSTHGEILDVRHEHPDMADRNPQHAFGRHPVSVEPASDERLMIVQRNGGIESPQGSYAEVMAYEAALQTHARNPNIPITSYSNEGLGHTDDGDWETVGGFSRQTTRGGPQTKAQTSSFADYSSSSTGQRPAGLPPGPFLEHVSHPRYIRTWNVLRDQGTGGTMMFPDHIAQAGSDLERYLNSPVDGQNSERHYQHPSPLSKGHTNPFTSSPVSADQGSASQYSGDDSNLAEESQDDFLMMSPRAKRTVKPAQGNFSLKDRSSTWVSTEEGHSVTNAGSIVLHGSSPMNQTGYQGNVTGTPEGTGTRQVGSSVANTSSPGAQFSSSPYLVSIRNKIRAPEPSKQIRKSLSIDSSLSSLQSLSSEDSYWTSTRNLPDQQVTDPGENELTALPSSAYLPPEARFHRNQLIANNLLPRDSTPRSKRRSRGFEILANSPSKLKEVTVTASANLSRHIQHFVPNMPSLSAVRKRSPHRRETQDEYVPSDVEMQSNEQSRGRKVRCGREKTRKKSKTSDSEGSSVSSDVGLTSSGPRQTTSGNVKHSEPSMSTSVEPVELEGVQVHPTLTSITHGPMSATEPATVAQNAAYQMAHANTSDFYLQRLLTPPSIERMLGAVRDNRRTPRIAIANRPIARAESPHLHRVPRSSTEAILRRQKELGRLILVPCMVLAPLCLLYGLGYLDGAMDYLTRGQLSEMRPMEKKIALGYGVASMTALIAVIVWFFAA